MKRTSSICDLVGLTHLEMASILKISRSHWSLYESGKRDLPLQATLLLAEIVAHMQDPLLAKSQHHVAKEETKKEAKLKALLLENEYQQAKQAKKIAALRKKYKASVLKSQLADFLANRSSKKETYLPAIAQSLTNKANTQLEKNGLATLAEEELKLQVLQFEKKCLESELLKG